MLGRHLRQLRLKAGLTGEQLGHMISRPQCTVSRWENHHGAPPVADLSRYLEAVGATREERLTALDLARGECGTSADDDTPVGEVLPFPVRELEVVS
jgi:transcriptional regulator with XRE-family HTH domain